VTDAGVAQIVQRLDELEKRFATAEHEREAAVRERDEYRALYLETMERCRKLELGLLASKSEHLPDNKAQLSLDVRLCDVEPWTYLRDILCLLPRWPEHRLLDLAPVAWTKTHQRDDVQSLLEKNPFRKLTLDSRN
jgi:hypothetical protein